MSESNQPIIEIRELQHAYKRQQALRSISFSVDPGSIHGFVGPNGAGKTTTLPITKTCGERSVLCRITSACTVK
jgi:ABC-2 type transport system ATP-binding protein